MRRDGPVVVLGLLGTSVLAMLIHGVLAVKLGIAYAIPTTIVAAIAAGVALRGPLGQALARVLHGESVDLPPEQVLGELDDLRTRLAELEERADFSERLLAAQREEAEKK